jgi:rod shape-determining protein MreC
VGGVFAAPVRWFGQSPTIIGGYFFAVSENRRLKRELAELQPWRDQAIALKNVNARYEAMLGLRPNRRSPCRRPGPSPTHAAPSRTPA